MKLKIVIIIIVLYIYIYFFLFFTLLLLYQWTIKRFDVWWAQLEYWKTEERDNVIKEHRIIYVDSTVFCGPSLATRHVRSTRRAKHRTGPRRSTSPGIDIEL